MANRTIDGVCCAHGIFQAIAIRVLSMGYVITDGCCRVKHEVLEAGSKRAGEIIRHEEVMQTATSEADTSPRKYHLLCCATS